MQRGTMRTMIGQRFVIVVLSGQRLSDLDCVLLPFESSGRFDAGGHIGCTAILQVYLRASSPPKNVEPAPLLHSISC